MSDIPRARELVAGVADWCESCGYAASAAELRYAVGLMVREPYARKRAPTKSARATALLSEAIRAFAAAHPEMTLQDIAEVFGVNAGRVSEALHGKR